MVTAALSSVGAGASVTYPVNTTITSANPTGNPLQSNTVSGSITTDGTLGALVASNILSWNLNLVDGLNSANNFNLTPANSTVVESIGGALSATATGLSFNFSGTGEFLIQANSPGAFSGSHYFCFSTGSACLAGETISPQFIDVDGVVATGTAEPVGTQPLQGNTYYFSDFAFGEHWESTLTYNNYSPQSVTCTTNFYGDNGAPLGVPFAQGTVTTRTDVLAAGGSIHDQTTAPHTGSVIEAWAQATCSGPVQASMLFRQFSDAGVPVAEAGVNAEIAPTTEFATFAQTATGIAYANPSTTNSATITFTAYNNAGVRLGSQTINLGPLAHSAANVAPLLGLQPFTGFVKITSSIPIVSLSLNYEAAPIFSSLPPGDLPSATVLITP